MVARPTGGIAEPSAPAWAWTWFAIGSLVASFLLLARRSVGARRSTYLGLASGTMNGATASLLKTCADDLAHGPLALLAGWHLYLLVVIGGTAFVLLQSAFQGGPLAAPLTALTLADPVVGVVIGVGAFGERLSAGGPGLVVLGLAAAVMARGIWLTSRAQPLRVDHPTDTAPAPACAHTSPARTSPVLVVAQRGAPTATEDEPRVPTAVG
jgi:hypothetical protein